LNGVNVFFVCDYSNFIQYRTEVLRSTNLGNFCERARGVSEGNTVSTIPESLRDNGFEQGKMSLLRTLQSENNALNVFSVHTYRRSHHSPMQCLSNKHTLVPSKLENVFLHQ